MELKLIDPYYNAFNPLVFFNENSSLDFLVQDPSSSYLPNWLSPIPAFNFLLSRIKPEKQVLSTSQILEQKLIKKIDFFNTKLFDAFSKSRFLLSMEKLRDIATLFFKGEKTKLIRLKLLEQDIKNPILLEKLNDLDRWVVLIASEPSYLETPPLSPQNEIRKPHRHRSNSKQIKDSMELSLSLQFFSMLHPKYHADLSWKENLISEFSKLKTFAEMSVVGAQLDHFQALEIFSAKNLHHKLPLFLFIFPLPILAATLISIDAPYIRTLNQRLRKCSEIKEDWFHKEFAILRDSFVDCCNKTKKKIDKLNKKLRESIENKDYLSSAGKLQGDVNSITSLREKTQINHDATLLFFSLFQGVICDAAMTQLESQLTYNFRHELSRLAHAPDVETQKQDSCPMSILEGKIFQDHYVDDDDLCSEIFSTWHLIYLPDYKECGFFPYASDEKFAAWLADPSKGYSFAVYNLYKIGITHISDWKRLGIYNFEMLQGYLARAEIQEHMISKGNPLLNQLGEWGLFPGNFENSVFLPAGSFATATLRDYESHSQLMLKHLSEKGIKDFSDLAKLGIKEKKELVDTILLP